ncbi:hypothetical protein ACVWZV_002208 [Bradyrhizobium sp. GM5.1]
MSLFGSSANQELSIVIKARDEASAAFKKIDDSLKSMGGGFEKAVSVSTKFAIGMAAAGVAVGAFGVASVKAASEAETKLAKMDATLATMGKTGLVARDSILKAAAASTKLGFDDEEAAISIANLFQRTGNLSEAMKLNSLAMDLARSKGIDLAESQKLISLVMSGNQRALKLYGIEISDTLTPMQALEELQKKVAGQSEAFANTFQGQVAVFHMEFDNLRETIGSALLPMLTAFLKALNPIVEKVIEWASNTALLVEWLKKHQTILIIIAGAITGALIPAFIALRCHHLDRSHTGNHRGCRSSCTFRNRRSNHRRHRCRRTLGYQALGYAETEGYGDISTDRERDTKAHRDVEQVQGYRRSALQSSWKCV